MFIAKIGLKTFVCEDMKKVKDEEVKKNNYASEIKKIKDKKSKRRVGNV